MRVRAAFVVVCLLVSGTAWAQAGMAPPVLKENMFEGTAVKPPVSPEPDSPASKSTSQCRSPRYSDEAWNRLDAEMKAIVCQVEAELAPEFAASRKAMDQMVGINQPPIRSRGLVIAGVVSLLGGIAMVIPAGTTYHIFGDDVCVTEYSVDAGGCRSVAPAVGAGMLAGGIAMIYFGSRPISVSPMIGSGVKGASATIKFGGSRARN